MAKVGQSHAEQKEDYGCYPRPVCEKWRRGSPSESETALTRLRESFPKFAGPIDNRRLYFKVPESWRKLIVGEGTLFGLNVSRASGSSKVGPG